jgi:hypothetical protein
MKELNLNELFYVSAGLSIDMSVLPTFVHYFDGMGSPTWFANTYYPLALATMATLITVGGTVIVGALYIASGQF